VIADEVTMTGTVRTMDASLRQGLEDEMRRVVAGISESWGAGQRVDYLTATRCWSTIRR